MLYDSPKKKDSSPTFTDEQETCLKYFESWSEADQVEFVENLLARMCHYQHGHIDAFLKPMLQRDFISHLPSNSHRNFPRKQINLFCFRERFRSRCRRYFIVFGCG